MVTDEFEKYLSPVTSLSNSSGLNGVDQIYVINLDERPEKWERIRVVFDALKLFPTRVPAINGWRLEKKAMLKLVKKGNFHSYNNCGKIGCTLSHLKVWKDAIGRNFKIIWVVEDDIECFSSPHVLSQLLMELEKIDPNWDILYTDTNIRKCDGTFEKKVLLTPPPPFIESLGEDYYHTKTIINNTFLKIGCRHGTYSMLISYRGLLKLYEFQTAFKIWAPIDHSIHYTPNLRQYVTRHPIVTHTIENRISDTECCSRELQ